MLSSVLIMLLVAGVVLAQDGDRSTHGSSAAADSSATAPADTTEIDTTNMTPAMRANLARLQAERDSRDGAAVAEDADAEPDNRIFHSCTNTPEVGTKANVTKANFFARMGNEVKVYGGGSISEAYNFSYDSYRRQDRTVEARGATVTYLSGEGAEPYKLLPVLLRLEASTNWSEDITVNSAGRRNTKQSETRRAGVNASRTNLRTGPVVQHLSAGWFYNSTAGVNLGETNERSDSELNGAVRTGIPIAEGLSLATRLYGTQRLGDNALAGVDSKAETTGDTLGVGGYYSRNGLSGKVVFTQSDFDRKFLDYRRNSNGLVDTTNIPEGASKIVEELEEKDAWEIAWENKFVLLRRFHIDTKMSHKYDKQQYNQSQVGAKERNNDLVTVGLSFSVGADSLAFGYEYKWDWDDQTFLGADDSRGRQYKKYRKVTANWIRPIFANTDLRCGYSGELAQDIAENEFNQNDRDRLTQDIDFEVTSNLTPTFYTSLRSGYLRKDDVAIRQTLSANNNIKRTYEVAPQYRWDISPRVQLQQTFRMYIQYQDYVYDALESVRKEDTFNKRGNLATKVTYAPNDRLEIIVKHDLNKKYNGTLVSEDLAGRESYSRDSNQTINRIEFGLTWEVAEGLKLQTASFRTEDETVRFSGESSSSSANRSGELWIGAVVDQSWDLGAEPLTFKGRLKRFLAYGPSVTDTSDDYWEADLLLKWTF